MKPYRKRTAFLYRLELEAVADLEENGSSLETWALLNRVRGLINLNYWLRNRNGDPVREFLKALHNGF